MHNPSLPPYEFDTGASGSYPPSYPLTSAGVPDATGLSCRLPLYAGGPGSGGFLVLPDETFVADPRSSVTVPPVPGAPTPAQQGMGYGPGWFGLTYDRVLTKWLPVSWQWVSPDGKHYAYPTANGIYVVDVNTSSQVQVGAGKIWQLIDVENDHLYAEEQARPGLWSLPFSGSGTQITQGGYWQAVGGGAAYGTATSAVPSGVATQIQRMDLSTGAVQPWFQVDGASTNVVGFDAQGHPLMSVIPQQAYYSTNYIWLVKGLGDATVLTAGQLNGFPVADKNGIWFSGGSGIYLFTGSTMRWISSVGGQLAGGCG